MLSGTPAQSTVNQKEACNLFRCTAIQERESRLLACGKRQPEILNEVVGHYVGTYIRAETSAYLELQPSRSQLKEWLAGLRRRAYEYFAQLCPGCDVRKHVRAAIRNEGEFIERTLIERARLYREFIQLDQRTIRLMRAEQAIERKRAFAMKMVWHRLDCGLSQDALADLVGSLNGTSRQVEKRNLRKYEAGRSLPSPTRLKVLANVFTRYRTNESVGAKDLLSVKAGKRSKQG